MAYLHSNQGAVDISCYENVLSAHCHFVDAPMITPADHLRYST